MKASCRKAEIATTFQELNAYLVAVDKCVSRLMALFGGVQVGTVQNAACNRLQRKATQHRNASASLDRHQIGRTVVSALAPEFNSAEFARRFRAVIPADAIDIFDAVRLKKILMSLSKDGLIEMIAPGRGRRPARYKVFP